MNVNTNKCLISDENEIFLSKNIDGETRTIYIGEPDSTSEGASYITAHTSADLIKSLLVLENISHEPITVWLNTFGGCMFNSLAIYDAMKTSPCEIKVIGTGAVMSGGSIIIQGASKGQRFVTPSTTLMLHVGSDSFNGHSKDFERWADHGKIMATMMYNIYATNGGIVKLGSHKADFWRKKLNNDWILTADDAVKWGIVDSVIRNRGEN